MQKIGICTIYTGFNYGSALQTYATKTIVNKIGYDPIVLKISGSFVDGRDVRLSKIFKMMIRSIVHPKVAIQSFFSYRTGYSKFISKNTKNLFISFYRDFIIPKKIKYSTLKKEAISNDYVSFICGSDQVWNSTSIYLDPFYYLEFSPKSKRIAFAPSFGKSDIPNYNKKQIKEKISKIEYLSIREDSGKQIIKELIGKDAVQLIDPTLVLTKEEWIEKLNLYHNEEIYILAYFLDKPIDSAIKKINQLEKKLNCKVIYVPYDDVEYSWETKPSGPQEFVNLVFNAKYIVTDSFHGTAFSIIFNKDFYVYSRNYGVATSQTTRIISLLSKMRLVDRLDNDDKNDLSIDYSYPNDILREERNKSFNYLKKAISTCIEVTHYE